MTVYIVLVSVLTVFALRVYNIEDKVIGKPLRALSSKLLRSIKYTRLKTDKKSCC